MRSSITQQVMYRLDLAERLQFPPRGGQTQRRYVTQCSSVHLGTCLLSMYVFPLGMCLAYAVSAGILFCYLYHICQWYLLKFAPWETDEIATSMPTLLWPTSLSPT